MSQNSALHGDFHMDRFKHQPVITSNDHFCLRGTLFILQLKWWEFLSGLIGKLLQANQKQSHIPTASMYSIYLPTLGWFLWFSCRSTYSRCMDPSWDPIWHMESPTLRGIDSRQKLPFGNSREHIISGHVAGWKVVKQPPCFVFRYRVKLGMYWN